MAAEGGSKSLSCENLQNIKVGEGQLGEGELLIPEGMRTETANLSDLVDAVFPSIATRFNDASCHKKATSSLFVSCLFVGEKVAFLSAQKATMKIICLP